MVTPLFCSLLLLVLVVPSSSISIGDRLFRSYNNYIGMPINTTSARASGWQQSGPCQDKLGIPYNYQASAPAVHAPMTFYFSNTGVITGIGMNVYGGVESKLANLGYFFTDGDGHRIIVTFSSVSSNCATNAAEGSLGDRLVINAHTIAHSVPVEETDAQSGNWHKGSCFEAMGHHWFYDLETAPKMSWQAQNLLPIVPMYNNGVLNAFFFADPTIQQGLFDSNWWDRVALPNLLMCYNFCDSGCTFSGTSFWSTGHVFLRDYTLVHCAGGCTTACCP